VYSCLIQDSVVYIRDSSGAVSEQTLAMLEPMLDADDGVQQLSKYQVLCRTGWTQFGAVLRRKLWEVEPLCQIKTRSGQVSLTGQHTLPVRRGMEELVVPASAVRAGDSLLVLDKPKLGKKAPPLGEQMAFRPYGVLESRKYTGYEGNVYQVDTEDGTLVVNGLLVSCSGSSWELPK
jgi:hypothetical protein